jgi:hypothetical protein
VLIADYLYLLMHYTHDEPGQRSPAMGLVTRAIASEGPAQGSYWDDAAAEVLLQAGRHYKLTGDQSFARGNLPFYERCAEFLISLIRPGEFLPVCRGSWDGQGGLKGKEPYFVAETYAGLLRLAEIEHNLGFAEKAERYASAAAAMKTQALKDYSEGGLWHTERGTFINHIDYRPLECTSPRSMNFSYGPLQPEGVIRTEYAHYETILPIWLGLLDDQDKIEAAFRWIDSHYTYASGRGGVTFPPFVSQTFIALLDVCVRLRHGIPGADRLLQLILDQAMAGGMPITEFVFGAYRNTGPLNPDWMFPLTPQTHTGRVWDNAPYFGAVMNLHYGLEYSHQGWKIGDPRPIANYPLSRVEGLRYQGATYTVTWEGWGTVKQIWLDGAPWPSNRLDLQQGSHEVKVQLG